MSLSTLMLKIHRMRLGKLEFDSIAMIAFSLVECGFEEHGVAQNEANLQ